MSVLASWHGFFGWYGWPSLVAVGTILLAAVTVTLALSTRRMAREAGNETRANWRPVLVIQPYSSLVGASPAVSLLDSTLSIGVTNIGRGPALGIRGLLQAESEAFGYIAGTASMDAAAAEERVVVAWHGFEPPASPGLSLAWANLKGEIICRDVSGAQYTTEFVLGFPGGDQVALVDHRVRPDAMFLPATRRELLVVRLRLLPRRVSWTVETWRTRVRGARASTSAPGNERRSDTPK